MASKRMIAKNIVDSDNFLEMPTTAQLLYFHLLVRGDDEGFIDNPRSIMRNVRCTEDDMRILIAKQYIIPFASGIVVIKHWKIHNYIRKDRLKATEYTEEKAMLSLNDNDVYEVSDECQSVDNLLTDKCQPKGNQMAGQYRLDKIRLDKSSSSREIEEATTTTLVSEELLSLYQDNIHPISPLEYEKLADDVERYGEQWCIEAIKRAVLRNKRTLGYIEGILNGWETNGFDEGKKKTEPPPQREKLKYFGEDDDD